MEQKSDFYAAVGLRYPGYVWGRGETREEALAECREQLQDAIDADGYPPMNEHQYRIALYDLTGHNAGDGLWWNGALFDGNIIGRPSRHIDIEPERIAA